MGPPGLQQDESNVLVQHPGADGVEEIIEDEMVKSAELEDPWENVSNAPYKKFVKLSGII